MKKLIWNMAVSLLFFSTMPAFCQSDPGGSAIPDEEYDIYKVILANLLEWCEVDSQTLSGAWPEADIMTSGGRGRLDRDLLKDLNAKNLKRYQLSNAFLAKMARGSENNRSSRQQVTFSRVGFDREQRHALIVVGRTFYYPEDVMNEGNYVCLEEKNGKWTVVNTYRAWSMRLGKIR